MSVFSRSNKIIPFFFTSLAILSLSSCNLMGFMDKPSGDVQLLDAARACLDKGDFACAKDYYTALSSNYADVKISESSLTTLEGGNIFFMSDLFSALGSGAGGPSSIVSLASTLYTRSKMDAATRVTIQGTFQDDLAITDSTLKAYSQLISSIAMLSSLLADGITTGGKLTPSDLAAVPATCKAAAATCAQAALCVCAECNAGAGTAGLTDDAGGTDAAVIMDTAALWTSAASFNKITAAATAANTAIGHLTGSGGGGILTALQKLSGLGTAGANCKRQILIQTLFP